MVRFHRRKVGARKYKDFTLENLQLAVSDVRNGVLSIRDAAANFVSRINLVMAMSDAHKNILRINTTEILNNVTNVPEVLDYLFRDGIITEYAKDVVMSKKTTKDKARELVVHHLPKRGDIAFYGFIVALVGTKQEFIAELLDPNLGGSDQVDNKDFSVIENLSSKDFEVETMNDAKKHMVSTSDENYKMRPSDCYGRVVIINNENFLNLKKREGTCADADLLKIVFEKLHFTAVVHKDLTASQIKEVLREERDRQDHADYQAFILCILSHGAKDLVYGTDGTGKYGNVALPEILNFFDGDECKALLGKPKFFFIQACQSDPELSNCAIKAWKTARPVLLPVGTHRAADVLLMLSTVAGEVSWRHAEKGSYFMRALCHVLAKYSHKENVDSLMTRVCNLVSSNRILTSGQGTTLQQPEKRSTLKKNFFFMP